MEVLDNRDVRCREEHECSWCWEQINCGEIAHFQKQVDAGEFTTVYTHLECIGPETKWAQDHSWFDEPRNWRMPRGKEDDDV